MNPSMQQMNSSQKKQPNHWIQVRFFKNLYYFQIYKKMLLLYSSIAMLLSAIKSQYQNELYLYLSHRARIFSNKKKILPNFLSMKEVPILFQLLTLIRLHFPNCVQKANHMTRKKFFWSDHFCTLNNILVLGFYTNNIPTKYYYYYICMSK